MSVPALSNYLIILFHTSLAPVRSCLRTLDRFCLGDGLAQLVLCEDGKTCMDISSFGRGEPEELTPFSWEITGADIVGLVSSCVGENIITPY